MPEIGSRIALTIPSLVKLKAIWGDNNIDINSKIRMLHSLVITILLYSCKTWTLTADIKRKIQMRSFYSLCGIFEHPVTNKEV